MVTVDTASYIKDYFYLLKKVGGTTREHLVKACSAILLKDILNGPLSYMVEGKDKAFWNSVAEKCFRGYIIPVDPYCLRIMYAGTSALAPTEAVIKTGTFYNIDLEGSVTSPLVNKKYFWIVLPPSYHLDKVENLNFVGDEVPLETFSRKTISIDGMQFDLYYIQTLLPLENTYKIIYHA